MVGHYARATAGVAIVAGALWAAWSARNVLVLVLIALVLAVGLDPGIRWLQRRFRMGRGLATALIMTGVLAFVGFFVYLVFPPIIREAQAFVSSVPGYISRLRASDGFLGNLEKQFKISRRLQEMAKDVPRLARASFPGIVGFVGSVAGGIFNFLTILVLTVYFMASMPRIEDGVALLFPAAKRQEYRELMDKATQKIGGYVSGNLTISLVAGIFAFLAFLIIGVPFPAALAMWIAITDLIPSVGALLGAVLCVLAASFVGVGAAVITLIYVLVYQQIENYVIAPRVMKKAVDLSPAAVVISVLIGGALLGFVGALLALPLAAAAKVVVRDLWLRDRIEDVTKARVGRRRPSRPSSGPGAGKK